MAENHDSDAGEEILSSVRRVVTPDGPPHPGGDLLVLTPALRVEPEADAPLILTRHLADVVSAPDAEAVAPAGEASEAAPDLTVEKSEWEAAFWSEPEGEAAPEPVAADPAQVAPPAKPRPARAKPKPKARSKPKPKPATPKVATPKVARGAAVAANAAPPGPEAPASSPSAEPAADPGPAIEPVVVEAEAPSPQGDGPEVEAIAATAAEPESANLDAAPAATLAAPPDDATEAEPEPPADMAEAAEPPQDQPLTADTAPATPEEPVPTAEPVFRHTHSVVETPMLTDQDGNPLTVLDEDALNDIVRQLIREELQGALGERITQTVRKLVRAEINRALELRKLE